VTVSQVIQAAVQRQVGKPLTIEPATLDAPQSHEAVVRIEACGICHMDLDGPSLCALPAVFGHEGVGVVEAVGNEARVKVGDRVILGYGSCGACPSCMQTQPFYCDQSWDVTFGGRRLDGSPTLWDRSNAPLHAAFFQQSSFATHAIVPDHCLVPMPRDVPAEVGASITCGVMTGAGAILNVLDVKFGETVLIVGAGAVGMGAVMAARRAGASAIMVADVRDSRLELARDLGATDVFNPRSGAMDEWVMAQTGRGVGKLLETSGNAAAFESAIASLRTGGHMAYAILPSPMDEYTLKPMPLFEKAARFEALSFGNSVPHDLYPRMLEWWQAGEFPVDRLIAAFPFADINRAIERTRSGDVIKAVLMMESADAA
jgi:aryl-alcohol dehydrogenase